ncbi:hypothetical protein fugu_019854 [Takifugu bimaculatus]|uniref:Resistance to inhibitors of cholinesterase protein 3 N-terminal domain-containing protein n=1 Tax=Takifugu bimaculatus TaxID=433685 RepID=A0A4Z2BGJ2_9TELE|nr:hypothetical protein fugu_019854 [Takifugu bimaculatus]
MVLSTSQQTAMAFTAVLLMFVVLPRLFGVGTVGENTFDPRYSRKGPGPGSMRGQPVSMNAPGASQSAENLQQMKKLMEQELKNDKYKANSNKGYVFTLMPLYAIGVGVFAAYKFLKIKTADDQVQKTSFVKGAKKSVEAENQLNELEQRLAQTEKMLNSILTQLDPLTNCVKSVAREQKDEIVSQLQTIRYLMKKRGMKSSHLTTTEASCGRNLDDLIESLGASEASSMEASPLDKQNLAESAEQVCPAAPEELEEEAPVDGEKVKELLSEEVNTPAEEVRSQKEMEEEDRELMPSLDQSSERDLEDVGPVEPVSGLRRRNRPE